MFSLNFLNELVSTDQKPHGHNVQVRFPRRTLRPRHRTHVTYGATRPTGWNTKGSTQVILHMFLLGCFNTGALCVCVTSTSGSVTVQLQVSVYTVTVRNIIYRNTHSEINHKTGFKTIYVYIHRISTGLSVCRVDHETLI